MKTIKLAVVVALALGATSAFATNGSTMIGMGAKTRGMGGTGIGVGHGAESALSNPALITTIKSDNEISFGGTLFMPDIETTNAINAGPAGATAAETATSDSDMFVIPSVSVANKVNSNFYWGVGMWGTGGLGVDYRDTKSIVGNDGVIPGVDGAHMQMVTALQLMQFGVPLVYTTNNFSVGVTPILQYGSLDINYQFMDNVGDPFTMGSGVADDLKFGYNIGMAYETNGLTLGAVYISEIEMEYDGVMSTVIAPFSATGAYNNDKLSSPAQYGVGASYKMKEHTLALDYKHINWEDADGYKDFEWQDQDVIAVGYEYATKGWALRAGYEFAESAVQNQTFTGVNSANLSSGVVNTFNMLGFPGTQETHVTFGGTYAFNEKLSLDLAAVFGLENEETMTNFTGEDITTKHSEQGYSFQLNYNF